MTQGVGGEGGEYEFFCFLQPIKQDNAVLASSSGQEKVSSSNIFTRSLVVRESKANLFLLAIAQYFPAPL